MDFVPIIYSASERRKTRKRVLGWLGPGSAAVAQAPALIATGILTPGSSIWIPVSLLGLMTVGFGMVIKAVYVPDEQKEHRIRDRIERIRASISEHYGLRISNEELKALSYPEDRPSSDFEVFGSMLHQERVSDSSFVELKVYLVWMDGRFQLSKSRDGKNFRELKPAQRALSGSPAPSALAAPSPTLAVSA